MPSFKFPFKNKAGKEVRDSALYYKTLSLADNGFYPLGPSGVHCGIHYVQAMANTLSLDEGMRAIAKGEIVAYQVNRDYPTVPGTAKVPMANGSVQAPFSTGFVLTRHTLEYPAGNTLTYFCLARAFQAINQGREPCKKELELQNKFHSRLVISSLTAIIIFGMQPSLFAQETSASPTIETISADEIRPGCSVVFQHSKSSTSPRNVEIGWSCKDGTAVFFDSYEEEGSTPEITSAFTRRNKCIVVLAKWHIHSRASSFYGDIYRIFIYNHRDNRSDEPTFTRHELLGKNKVGWDGVKNGKRITFPLNSEDKINGELDKRGSKIPCD
ncbi:hypothetical protein ACKI2N_007665 [Cupriavidus sp. 30B13]|uniref:hypothetical protein n=1 Tax=Cupriavidus sp. 30B13 TaxID=3384241 RepID=UPI003B8FFBE9